MTKLMKQPNLDDLAQHVATGVVLGSTINLLANIFWPVFNYLGKFAFCGLVIGVVVYALRTWRFHKQRKSARIKPAKKKPVYESEVQASTTYVRPRPGVHTALTITTPDGMIVGMVNGHAGSVRKDIIVIKEPSGRVVIRNMGDTPIRVNGHCNADLTVQGAVNVSNATWKGTLMTTS